ncbi:DEAD/DEAH box helicase [candidate division KSB1 bacterium]|nr:DEAD/DEAH box helicase [candidate division KSB1 bacterium]
MNLRDYQTECLNALRSRYLAGKRRQLVCLPTGTGKTVIFAQFPAFFNMKKRMLVLAHREELLNQARDKILRANPHLNVDIEQANRTADENSDVVIASVQTIGRRDSKRIKKMDPDQFYLIVVDEAHHATAETYRRTLEYFKVFEENTKKLLVGFTATPKRGDGEGLEQVFEEISYSKSLPEMISAGYLTPLAAYRVETDVDLSGVHTRMGDFVTGQLSRTVNVNERNALIVKVFRDFLQSRQTLCFCVDVNHTLTLAEGFRKNDIPTAAVTGSMDREERAKALADFQSGKCRVLTNCMVLTEGYDETSISGIILARPTKSALLYTQMIGRGTRLHPGKKDVVVIDIVDVTRDNKLVNLATLFGLPPAFDMEGHTTQHVQEALNWVEENRPWVRTDLATSMSDLRYRCQKISLFEMQTPDEITQYSDFAWMKTGPGSYRLNLANSETVIIAPTILGDYEVTLRKFHREETLGKTPALIRALGAADRYVEINKKDSLKLVNRKSAWRHQPVSARQRQILESRGFTVPKKMTKGQASHIIGMLFHK